MEKFEFDQTRKNIRIDELSGDDRENTFKRFRSVGGEIIKERSIPEEKTKRKRKISASEIQKRKKALLAEKKGLQIPQYQSEAGESADTQKEKRVKGVFTLTALRSRAKKRGISSFFGKKINSAFLFDMAKDLRFSCLNLNLFAREILKKDKEAAGRLLPLLKTRKPLYLFLLKQSVEVYKREEASILLGANAAGPKIYYKNAKGVVTSILKNIHYLKSYQAVFIDGLKFNIEAFDLSADQNKKFSLLAKRAEQGWTNLTTNIYSDFVLLIQRMELNAVKPETTAFEKIIGFKAPQKQKEKAETEKESGESSKQ